MLPQGWVETEASEVGTWGSGGTPKSTEATYYNGNIPWIRSGDLPDQEITKHEIQITEAGLNACAAKWVPTNSVLVALYGATIGKIGITTYPVTTNQAVAFCTPCEAINPRYLATYFLSIREKLISLGQGGAQPNISQIILKQQIVPLPSLAEQRRIVAKLDSLTARITRARAELKRVQVLKVHLRQQALRSCFTDLEKHELPLGELLRGIESGKNMRCVERPPVAGEKGVVKVSAVTWGHFDTTQTKTLPNDYLPPTKARIMKGDLLISRANTLELVGAAVIVEVQPDNIFLSDKILRLLVEEDKKSWILWYLRSPEGRSQIESFATGNQLSMRNISQAALRQINIPLPTASIRQQRLARLTATIKAEVSLETEAQRALTLLNRLESSLLAKAFRGELVPQDPNDEPASVLLNRIRAEHAADTKPKRGRKQSTQDMSLPRKRQTEKHD